jgi:hypothetical protein
LGYHIRWGEKAIVPSLQFDPVFTNAFGIDPATHQNWWTAHKVSNPPSPATTGGPQSFTLTSLPAGLVAGNFSVKAAFTPVSGTEQRTLPVPPSMSPKVWSAGNAFLFSGLPQGAIVKIYSVAGRSINTVKSSNGSARWGLDNAAGKRIVSAIYFYRIADAKGKPYAFHATGKMVVLK